MAIVVIILAGIGWAMFSERRNLAAEDALRKALPDAARSQQPVRVAEVVTFPWDRLLFACSYEAEETVEQRLGFTWGAYPGVFYDGVALWIFTRGKEVTARTQMPRHVGDPCDGSMGRRTFDKSQASFRLERTPEVTTKGDAWYRLVPLTAVP
ncbi:MAG: hypothetical protein JJD92_09135 [Frankiaceae bacterium]|nr:hypothetical protein [Frankiaceae bacterium]